MRAAIDFIELSNFDLSHFQPTGPPMVVSIPLEIGHMRNREMGKKKSRNFLANGVYNCT